MLYFVGTTNTCRPINITILLCELDICISLAPTLGLGGCSSTLPYSKFRHISWEQMMTEHRGFSIFTYDIVIISIIVHYSLYSHMIY